MFKAVNNPKPQLSQDIDRLDTHLCNASAGAGSEADIRTCAHDVPPALCRRFPRKFLHFDSALAAVMMPSTQ